MRRLGSGRGGRSSIAMLAVAVAVLMLGVGASRAPGDSSATSGLPPSVAACKEKPTVVLVHGAWANESSWSGEIRLLQRDGYVVRAVPNPLRGLTPDAADVAAFLETISGPIVLVGHSYGGAVITNAAAGNRQVKALVYVDAAAPAVGETAGQLSGKGSALSADPETLYDLVPESGEPAGDTDLYLKERVFRQSFGPDLSRQTTRVLWASQSPAAMDAFTTPSSAAAWKTIPSWYVIGTADKIITPESQKAMAHRAHAPIRLVPGGSHLTLISHPGAVTAQILAAVDATCS